MRLDQLQYFLSVARTHSINKSSLEFYTTHQGISKSIRQLENEIGTPLFSRSKKGMDLTAAGELLLPAAETSVRVLHEALLQINNAERNQDLAGVLSISGTTLTNTLLLPSLFEDFSLLYPQVHFDVRTASQGDILRSVALHRDALGFTTIIRAQEYQDLYEPYIHQSCIYSLQQDEFVCLVSKNSPLAERTQISFSEFATYPVACSLPDTHDGHILSQLLARAGSTEPTFFSQSPRLIAQAITSGRYIAFSSRRSHDSAVFPELHQENTVVIPFIEDLSFDIALVTNLQPQLDEIGETFVAFVKNTYPKIR